MKPDIPLPPEKNSPYIMDLAPSRQARRFLTAYFPVVVAIMSLSPLAMAADSAPQTKVLKWPEGKQAVFLLQFDDSAPSAIKNAIPELTKRNMVGTFYINPGNAPYKSQEKEWANPAPGIVYANHTYTHVGATSVDQLDQELAKCNAEIMARYPDRKQPRLISFGQPGGVPWTITAEEKKALLTKHHLIDRPPFKGYPFQFKTLDEMLALVEKALAKGDMEYLVFHGVGGDWLVTPMDMYVAILDKLQANQDKIWITDPVSWHQYVTERTGAEVKTLSSDKDQITVQLTSPADPALYDLPLTLSTTVPADWREVQVKQGSTEVKVPVKDGLVQYAALPGTDPIAIHATSRK